MKEINLEIIRKFIREDKFIISSHARIRMFQRNIFTDDIEHLMIIK